MCVNVAPPPPGRAHGVSGNRLRRDSAGPIRIRAGATARPGLAWRWLIDLITTVERRHYYG